MIQIEDRVLKKQENFWSHCHFHPTDAIEDPWGKRILDRMAADRSVRSVRMYTMFEDIVYRDEHDRLCFDFRLNDLRLAYMLESGFDIVLCYNFMPECIAENKRELSCVSKNKTRYKGKMINTSVPVDYKEWEEVCYVYTAHILEKFGVETVSQWRIQCFNEPDIPEFFMSNLPREDVMTRAREYCRLYRHFEAGIRRATDRLHIGGPVLASSPDFLGEFLRYVRENGLQLDFVSLHNYGTDPASLENGRKPLNVKNNLKKQAGYYEILKKYGFENKEILLDEWGAATGGFCNRERCPSLMFRETEVFSAYYVKLIAAYMDSGLPVSRMLICLSGQHEMTEDFSGFRNFFTLHFIAKPIYNAFRMASKLKENLLTFRSDAPEVSVIATKEDGGAFAFLLCYASETFEESLPDIKQEICFPEALCGKHLQVYCIDRNTTNPYRLYQSQHMSPELKEEEISRLREEGQLKPVMDVPVFQDSSLNLTMTANSVFLITAENP